MRNILRWREGEMENGKLFRARSLGFIAQGLMQYLSVYKSQLVWGHFKTWLRTVRPDIPPSEKVVGLAMSQVYNQFIADNENGVNFKEFIRKRTVLSPVKDYSSSERQVA